MDMTPEIVFSASWWQQPTIGQAVPTDLFFVCAFSVDHGTGMVDAAVYHRRSDDRDELWMAHTTSFSKLRSLSAGEKVDAILQGAADWGARCVMAIAAQTEPHATCLYLLGQHFGAYGKDRPAVAFFAGGIVNEGEFTEQQRQLRYELEDQARVAQGGDPEIVQAARQLGLQPRPTGPDADVWQATCPSRRHRLLLYSMAGTFTCGWCGRSGNVDDLRAFVAERRKADATRPLGCPVEDELRDKDVSLHRLTHARLISYITSRG